MGEPLNNRLDTSKHQTYYGSAPDKLVAPRIGGIRDRRHGVPWWHVFEGKEFVTIRQSVIKEGGKTFLGELKELKEAGRDNSSEM